MAITYIASVCPNYVSGSDTSMATDATGGGTLNVAAHDILVVWYSWEDGTGGTLGCGDGGTNTFTLSSELGSDGKNYGVIAYCLDCAANATAVITATNSTTRGYRSIMAMQFRPSSGTVSLDQALAVQSGTEGSLASPSITTTGTDEVVVGFGKDYAAGNYADRQISTVAADQTVNQAVGTYVASMWSRILTGTMTGTATATVAASYWLAGLLSIKAAATGQFARPISVYYARLRG